MLSCGSIWCVGKNFFILIYSSMLCQIINSSKKGLKPRTFCFVVQSYDRKKVIGLGFTAKNLDCTFYIRFFQGKTIESDMVLRCTGLKPNVSMTKDLFGKFKFSKIALWPQFYMFHPKILKKCYLRGQLFSKGLFRVVFSTKKPTKLFLPLPLKSSNLKTMLCNYVK